MSVESWEESEILIGVVWSSCDCGAYCNVDDRLFLCVVYVDRERREREQGAGGRHVAGTHTVCCECRVGLRLNLLRNCVSSFAVMLTVMCMALAPRS